jgi:hypothetical protein
MHTNISKRSHTPYRKSEIKPSQTKEFDLPAAASVLYHFRPLVALSGFRRQRIQDCSPGPIRRNRA